jgi:TATA-box binding protein (TBP) (component of TFIID and TFIIIB)
MTRMKRTATAARLDDNDKAARRAKPLFFPNTVCTLKLRIKLDLVEVSRIFLSKYDKSIFPAVEVKCWNTKATVCIFKSGNIVITGAKADDPERSQPGIDVAILTGLLTAYRLTQCLGITVRIYEIRIPNIVASMALGFGLYMAAIRQVYGAAPEAGRFPGLRIADKKLKVTFIVFSNGKVNVTGLKGIIDSQHGHHTIDKIEQIKAKIGEFHRYRVSDSSSSTGSQTQ